MDDQVLAELFRESDNVKSKTIIDENIKVSASSSDYLLINDKIETVSEANDLLKNGILIETREGVKLLSLTDALTSGVGGLNLSVEDFHHVATQLLSNQPITALLDIPPKPLESIAEVGDGIAPHSNSLTENDFGGNFPPNKTQKDIGPKFESKKTEIIPQSTVTLGGSASIGASPLAEAFKNAICDNEVEVGGNKKPLESIAEIGDNITYSSGAEDNCFGLHFLVNQSANDNQLKYEIGKTSGILPRNILTPDESVSESSSPLVGVSESANSDSSVQSCNDKVKRKGGWPKGRKRKPELYENRPPKAPSTGYVFYLNEKRKLHKNVPFSEVTKLLGNEWSKLSLEEKRAYLESAEVDKKRYREELRIYRKSEAYQSYLRRKRLKSLQANGTEESDVDATDELDEEDNEELYCRVCDQWFVTLHNKKEHLHGRQHFQNISQFEAHTQGGGRVSSLDESSLDGAPVSKSRKVCNETVTMSDAIAKVFQLQAERDKEITYLKKRLETQMNQKREYIKAMQRLKAEEERLSLELQIYKRDNQETEKKICNIWKVLCL